MATVFIVARQQTVNDRRDIEENWVNQQLNRNDR